MPKPLILNRLRREPSFFDLVFEPGGNSSAMNGALFRSMEMDPKEAARPIRKLRKILKVLSANPHPDCVHQLRAQTRRLDALARVLSREVDDKFYRALKMMKPIGKAAAKVRDMDVLIAKSASLSSHGQSDAIVRLVEHMSALRDQHAKRLSRKVKRHGDKARMRLKLCLKSLERMQNEGRWSSALSPTQPRILAAKLEHWPKVDRENLHEFRKGVRELRDMLQLLSHLGEQPLPAFDGVKDRTGEWHDWQELECIAASVLDPDGGDAGLLREIRMIVRGKFDAALAEARALQKRNLLTAAAA